MGALRSLAQEAMTTKMEEALNTGATVQSGIRLFIRQHRDEDVQPVSIATAIAEVVGDFKTNSERHIIFAAPLEEQVTLRKKANNIINDVSRICRDTLGYCIVNHKRSGGEYSYKAIPAGPVAEKPKKSILTAKSSECRAEHFDPARHMVIPGMDEASWIMAAWNVSKFKLDIIRRPVTAEQWIKCALRAAPCESTPVCTLEELGRAIIKLAKAAKSESLS